MSLVHKVCQINEKKIVNRYKIYVVLNVDT